MRRAVLPLAVALALACGLTRPDPVHAEDGGEGREAPSAFWHAIEAPGWQRAQVLLRHGMIRFGEAAAREAGIASGDGVNADRAAYLDMAIARFARAVALIPDDPDALYRLAITESARDTLAPGNDDTHGSRIVRTLEHLRQVAPTFQAGRVAFELGIEYTRRKDFHRAAAEYRRCLAYTIDLSEQPPPHSLEEAVFLEMYQPPSRATTHYNLAEVTMQLGDLEAAVVEYGRAVAQSNDPRDRALALWGLSVALDRLGDQASAVTRGREALHDAHLDVLEEDGVFFEPPYELYYYLGVGHLAEAAEAQDAAERARALMRAAQSFERFLHEGGSASPWAELARHHVDALHARGSSQTERAHHRHPASAPADR